MTKFIKHSERVTIPSFSRSFVWRNDQNAGFGFDCDKDGNLLSMGEAARANFDKCVSGEYDVIDQGVKDFSYKAFQPAVIECDKCGAHVTLDSAWANECRSCGTEYNGFGQQLAPRAQWGEETGETFTSPNWTNDY